MGIGLILISLSLILKRVSPDYSIQAIAFFQGFCIGLGILFIVLGSIQKKRVIE
jgi:hypothetical protein